MLKKISIIIFALLIGFYFGFNLTCVSNAEEYNGSYYYFNNINNERDKDLYSKIENAIENHNLYTFVWDDCNSNDIKNVFDLVLLDHPDFFEVEKELKILSIGKFKRIGFSYSSFDEKAIESSINNIILNINEMSTLEKVSYLYDYLIDVSYKDSEFVDTTIYGSLINKESNCEGYSEAFSYILNKLGIENYLISNTVDGVSHRWNKVNIDDEWYEFDITYDATDNNETWDYFMVKSAH